jgi:hypothetical protein
MIAKTPKHPALTVVGPAATGAQPPRNLGPTGRKLWTDILHEYRIEDRAGLELLCLACEAVERAERLRALIDEEGEIVRTKTGPRSHPGLRDELQNRAFVARTLERLGLNVEPVKAMGRPPTKGAY